MEEWEIINMKREQKTIPSKCEFLGAVITIGVVDFWFGIGVTLAVKTVNGVEEIIRKC